MKQLLTKASRIDPGVLLPSTMVDLLLRIVKHIYLGEEESMMAFDSAQTPVFGPLDHINTDFRHPYPEVMIKSICELVAG